MTKQRTERILKDILKTYPSTYYLKLQVNAFAHTKMLSDFLVMSPYLTTAIECKECQGESFPFNRLTQESLLNNFDLTGDFTQSLILICFWKGNRKKSLYTLLTIREYLKIKERIIRETGKKSFNIKDISSQVYTFSGMKERLRLRIFPEIKLNPHIIHSHL